MDDYNKKIDKILYNTSFIRIGRYTKNYTNIDFKCLISTCNHIWSARPNNIFNGYGCPECYKINRKIPLKIVDEYLSNLDIKRLSEYDNYKTIIIVKCLKENCNNIWSTTFNYIKNNKRLCDICMDYFWTNNSIDLELKNRNIKRMSDYTPKKMTFKCLKENCEYIWDTTASSVISNGHGCSRCSGNERSTNEIVDKKLISRNIKRLDDYNGTDNKIRFQCLIAGCETIWETAPNYILNYGNGCPNCNVPGINEKLVNNILKNNNFLFQRHKLYRYILNNKKMFVDFYLEKYNTIIEYDGAQHFKPIRFGNMSQENANANFEKQKLRDQTLVNYCIENNINLIRINGIKYKYKKLENYINNIIIPSILQKLSTNHLYSIISNGICSQIIPFPNIIHSI